VIRKSSEWAQVKEFRKRGFTYGEIAKIVGVSKSTVSLWLSRETWSQSITNDNQKRAAHENGKRISLLNTARGNQNIKLYKAAERSAELEFKHYKKDPHFIAGVAIYLTQGDVSPSGSIRLTSVRKDVHRLFITFALEYLGVSREKIRFWLLFSPQHKPLASSRAWAKILKLPLAQFHKYQVGEQSQKKTTLHDGVGNTIIGDTVLKKKLMKWVELASKEL